jgi:ribonuclease P protein component
VRVAIVVPKFGFSIVRRNKLKRRLRELVRVHVLPRPASCDLIVRASRQTYAATFDELRGEMTTVADEIS